MADSTWLPGRKLKRHVKVFTGKQCSALVVATPTCPVRSGEMVPGEEVKLQYRYLEPKQVFQSFGQHYGSSVCQELGKSLKEKPNFPVTCGNKEGVLHKNKYNKSQPCILCDGRWFTPTEFEKLGGKEKNKKWKISICHNQIQLQTLIQDGFLSSPSFKTKRSQAREIGFRRKLIRSRRSDRHGKNSHACESVSTSESSSESDRDDDDGDKDDDEDEDDGNDNVINVTCSTGKGVLHLGRFATETCGKCIRTRDAWLTPKDFLEQNKANGNWRRDIESHDGPLGMLIMKGVVKPHRVNCKCPICTGDPLYMLDQNNDDVCFKCSGEGDLVCCEKCPRAFHHHCHKPALRDDTIGEHWTCSFCQKSVPAENNKST